MDFFDALSLLVGIALLIAGFFRQKTLAVQTYREALAYFVAALILYFPVSAIYFVGPYLSLAAKPIGFILQVLRVRLLCLALISQSPNPT